MPPPETFERNQKAVLWEKTGDNDYGDPIFDSPVEIEVRWENRQQEAKDPFSVRVAIDAVVVTTEAVPINSRMWEGELEDWYEEGSVGDETNLMQVVAVGYIPDLKNRVTRRVLGLMRYRNPES